MEVFGSDHLHFDRIQFVVKMGLRMYMLPTINGGEQCLNLCGGHSGSGVGRVSGNVAPFFGYTDIHRLVRVSYSNIIA